MSDKTEKNNQSRRGDSPDAIFLKVEIEIRDIIEDIKTNIIEKKEARYVDKSAARLLLKSLNEAIYWMNK